MEKNITVSLTEEELDEIVDALQTSMTFWGRAQNEEKMHKIEGVKTDIIRQKAELYMKGVI